MRHTLFITTVLLLATTACQKSRADYRDDIAGAICSEMQTCDKIGPDGKFANFDDCMTDISGRYNDMWSAKECEARIDSDKFDACKKRAVTNACSGNILDALSFRVECGADDVCVAPVESTGAEESEE